MAGLSFNYNNAGDLYARAIGFPLRSYRLPDAADYALLQDPDAYSRLRRDATVAFALRYRKLLAAGRDWYLEAAGVDDKDRTYVQVMEALLRALDCFETARFNLAEAIIAGSRWAKIQGERRVIPIAGIPDQEWWVATRLRDVDKRRLRQFPLDLPDQPHQVQDAATYGAGGPTRTEPLQRRRWIWQIYRPLQLQWEEINPDEWVRHIYDDREDTLGYGGGLASELYTYWYAKEVALQHGLQYLERWSQGLIIARVNSLRDGKATLPTSSDRANSWLNNFAKMRSRHILVADKEDEVQLIDAPAGGWQAALEAIRYLDGAIRVAILGSTLPTSQDTTGGSYALAEVQQETTEALARFDMAGIEETLRRDLLGWLARRNQAQLRALGIADRPLPFLRLRESRRQDPQARADVLLKVRQAQMDIRLDEAYAQTGFTPPTANDAILPPLAAAESMRQTGEGAQPGDFRSGPTNATAKQGRLQIDRTLDEAKARNPLRPDNRAGSKGLREKAIDSATSPFAAAPDPTAFEAQLQLLEREIELLESRARNQQPTTVNVTPQFSVTMPPPPELRLEPRIEVAAAAPANVHVEPRFEVNVPQQPPAQVQVDAHFAAPAPAAPAQVIVQQPINLAVPPAQVNVDARSTVNIPERQAVNNVVVPEREVNVLNNFAAPTAPDKPKRLEITRSPVDGTIQDVIVTTVER